MLRDLWQSDGDPPFSGVQWWELWLHRTSDGLDLLRRYAQTSGLTVATRTLRLGDRDVAWLRGTWQQLQSVVFTTVPLAEIRRAEFAETTEELPRDDQDELAEDLAQRDLRAQMPPRSPCATSTPASCTPTCCSRPRCAPTTPTRSSATADPRTAQSRHADGGARALRLPGGAAPAQRARRASPTGWSRSIMLARRPCRKRPARLWRRHRRVRFAPRGHRRCAQRVFCMPITSHPTIRVTDSVVRVRRRSRRRCRHRSSQTGIEVLGPPSPGGAAVRDFGGQRPCRLPSGLPGCLRHSAIQDPAHAWNALTVGAHTELISVPPGSLFAGWKALAAEGDVSPSQPHIAAVRRAEMADQARHLHGGRQCRSPTVSMASTTSTRCSALRSTDTRNDLAIGSIKRHQRRNRAGREACRPRDASLPVVLARDDPRIALPRRRVDTDHAFGGRRGEQAGGEAQLASPLRLGSPDRGERARLVPATRSR